MASGRKKRTVVTTLDDDPIAPLADATHETDSTSEDGNPAVEAVTGGPVEDRTDSPSETLREALIRILSVPRARGAVPVLASYRQGFFERYFILDVDSEAFRKAWDYYKEHVNADPVGFTQAVIKVLEVDFPRMYRAVVHVPLN